MLPSYDENAGEDDEPGGGLQHIAMPLGAALLTTAHLTSLPLAARLARLGRKLRGEAYRPRVVWRNSTLPRQSK